MTLRACASWSSAVCRVRSALSACERAFATRLLAMVLATVDPAVIAMPAMVRGSHMSGHLDPAGREDAGVVLCDAGRAAVVGGALRCRLLAEPGGEVSEQLADGAVGGRCRQRL